jgi:4-aminobutyrate aminotransferase
MACTTTSRSPSSTARAVRVDAEGNEYLDFFAGILTTMTGYKVPEVVDAIKAQAEKMLHTSTLYLIEPRSSWPRRSPRCRASPTPRCSSPTRAPRPTTPP